MSEEFGADFITISDENGNEFELELVGTIEVDGTTYMAFFPAETEDVDIDMDDEENGMIVLKSIEEDGEEIFATLDSDEEAERIYDLFMEQLFEEAEE
jgi:Protein of unknown function (DUF1292).